MEFSSSAPLLCGVCLVASRRPLAAGPRHHCRLTHPATLPAPRRLGAAGGTGRGTGHFTTQRGAPPAASRPNGAPQAEPGAVAVWPRHHSRLTHPVDRAPLSFGLVDTRKCYPQNGFCPCRGASEDDTLISMSTPRLIRASEFERLGQDPHLLAKLSNKGELIRLRRGIYVKFEDWKELNSRERYGLWAMSFQCLTGIPPTFCHASAALVWGLWIVGTPRRLHVVTESIDGGRSRNTIVRHRGSLTTGVLRCGPVLVTDKLTTTMHLITTLRFPYAVAVCDSSRRATPERDRVNTFTTAEGPQGEYRECSWSTDAPQGLPLLVSDLLAQAELLPSKAARDRATAVINFSSAVSGSAGESLSRAKMHELHFPEPELQQKFVLRDGSNAFVDFWFKEQQTVGEFDGLGKYLRGDWGGGLSLEKRILAEKRREDQIRAQGVRFVRWTWNEMMDSAGFQLSLIHI